MNTKELARIAIMGCIQFICFNIFSDILYLEVITIITIIFAIVFSRKQAILGSIIFCVLNIIINQGLNTWTIMYLIIYPTYSLIISLINNKINESNIRICIICFIFSFMTGQLLQIPYMLIEPNITIYYIIFGLKTSLIQATITSITCFSVSGVLIRTLRKIKGRN